MRKDKPLPIVFGCYDAPDKCILADHEKHRITICRLKQNTGLQFKEQDFSDDVIEGVIKEIWFSKKESLQAFIAVLQSLERSWGEEE